MTTATLETTTADHFGATSQAVEYAIELSKREDRTVTIECGRSREAIVQSLYVECDGSSDDEREFWGADLDGRTWRIRLVR